MIPVYIIVGLVLIGLPVLLGKLTGTNPMEIMFGQRVNSTIFGRKKKEQEDSADNGADSETSTESAESSGKKEKSRSAASQQKNSSKQELMKTISDLLSYGRKQKFFCVVPGTLIHGDDVASLAVLMVTRKSVLGFNCFGYGGTIIPGNGDEDWKQIINGEEKPIPSPIVRNRKQKEILDAVLRENGYPDLYTEIYGVFTASGVTLKDNNSRKTYCCTQKLMMELLNGKRFLEDRGVKPQEVGKMLEGHTKAK